MIKMWKRLICVTLSVLMIMSVLPVGVLASGTIAETSIALNSSNLTGEYTTNSDGSITISSTTTAGLMVNLGQTVSSGSYVTVRIKGSVKGEFRMYLVNYPNDYNKSSIEYASHYNSSIPSTGTASEAVSFDITVTLTSTDDSVNGLMIKHKNTYDYEGSGAGTGTLNDLTITSISVVTTNYTISVGECTNGTVVADKTYAAEGEEVTLTVTPATGYELSTLTVTDSNGDAVTVTNNKFTMPASDVTVNATFIADHCTSILDQDGISTNSTGSATLESGSLTAGTSTSWIVVELDKSYAVGEQVTIHITGTTDTSLRWYLSASNGGEGNITSPVYFHNYTGTDGATEEFDATYTFTVQSGTGFTGTEALYLFIKPGSGNFSSLTITHLGVVQYDVGVSVSGDSYGSVTADKTRAGAGETVSLTVAANENCRLVSLSVTDSTGAEIELSDTYTFIMPASDVTVTAEFDNYCTTNGHSYKNGVCTVCGATYTATTGTVTSSVSLTDSSVSKMGTGGTLTVSEGSVSIVGSDASGLYIYLGHTFAQGTTVKLTISGTTYDNFRIALTDGADQEKRMTTTSDDGWTYVSNISDSGITSSTSSETNFSFTVELTLDKGSANYLTIKAKSYDAYFSSALTINSISIVSSAPTFFGRSLNLDGEIGVTYYFDMDGVLDVDSYQLYATVGNGSEQTISSTETCTINGTECYCYTVYVKPTEIDSAITAYLSDGTNKVEVSEYSVYSYCSYAITTAGWESEKNLCEAVLNYGYYAQIWQNQTSSIDIKTNLDSSWSDPVTAETWSLSDSSTGTDSVSKTLALDGTGIYIRAYVDEANKDSSYTVDGKTLTVESATENGSKGYYVEFKVAAKYMGTEYTILKDGETYATYSVYRYIYNTVNLNTTASDSLKNFCKAIYYYAQAAASYSDWQ